MHFSVHLSLNPTSNILERRTVVLRNTHLHQHAIVVVVVAVIAMLFVNVSCLDYGCMFVSQTNLIIHIQAPSFRTNTSTTRHACQETFAYIHSPEHADYHSNVGCSVKQVSHKCEFQEFRESYSRTSNLKMFQLKFTFCLHCSGSFSVSYMLEHMTTHVQLLWNMSKAQTTYIQQSARRFIPVANWLVC